MRNPKLVPYETIVRATSGEPEAVDEVLRHYSKRIRFAALENGHVNTDTEDSIKQRLSPVNDELLSAVGKLTAEYGKIGGNLNQIARCLNEYGAPYNALSQEVRAATAELAALKFEVLQKVGEAVGNIQTYQL